MTTMTAEVGSTSDTATRQWDDFDRELLSVLDSFPATLTGLMDSTGYSETIVKDAILGYLQGGYAVRTVGDTHRYELTLAGRARLAQLAEVTVPAMRKAA